METVDCPYCSDEYEFDTADVRDEGLVENVVCTNCNKEFEVYLSISWNYHSEVKS